MPQWEKGQSGNPAGRPVGSKNVQSQLYEELQTHGLEILAPLIEKAKSGESPAGRFLLRRLLPAVKSAPIQVPLLLEGSPSQQAEQVKQRLAESLLTIEEAKANLADALRLALQCQRELAEKGLSPLAVREVFEIAEA